MPVKKKQNDEKHYNGQSIMCVHYSILNCLLWPILLLCNRQFRVGYVISVLYINVNRQMNSINIIGVARNFVWGGPNRAACKLYELYIYNN